MLLFVLFCLCLAQQEAFTTVQTGDGTYYGENTAGHCTLWPLSSFATNMKRVALNHPQYQSGDLSQGCGMCIKVWGDGTGSGAESSTPPIGEANAWTVYVTDECPECLTGSIDFGFSGDGRWNIFWKAIDCPTEGGLQYLFQGSNPYYLKLQVRNNKIPVTSLEFSLGGTWFTGVRTDDNFFLLPSGVPTPVNFPLTVRITGLNGDQLTDQIASLSDSVQSGLKNVQLGSMTGAPPTPVSNPVSNPVPVSAPNSAPVPVSVPKAPGNAPWRGVNLAGLEFGADQIPGTLGTSHIAPTTDEIDYFLSFGFSVFRLPFLWERLQATENGDFDSSYLALIDGLVTYTTSKGARIVLDPHNYARYMGHVIGDTIPVTALSDLWTKLANKYKDNSKVLFGIMNEPNSMDTQLWANDATTATAAIRATGAANLILVPGNFWTGAHSWSDGSPSNADVFSNFQDSNFAIEVHQYLDSDSSGTSDSCVSATIGSERLTGFTTWARSKGFKAFLGEWAGGRNDICSSAISDVVKYLDSNSDVYIGWTWWAAGPWWGDYMFALDKDSAGADRPQLSYLVAGINAGPQDPPQDSPQDLPPVNGTASQSKGWIAAAVILPLVAIAVVCAVLYVLVFKEAPNEFM